MAVTNMQRRFFAYRTLADIRAEVERLGLEVRFEEEIREVGRPVRIGARTAGNAFAIHPMEGCDGNLDGTPGELTIRRWERFGAGGAKIIWGEATAVLDEARANPRQLWLHEGSAAAFEDLLRRTRKAHRDACGSDGDLLVGLQLTHSGRYSFRRPLIALRDPVLDPATLLDKKKGTPIPADYPLLSDADLEGIEDRYLDAARLAVKAGFDFLDLKQCHRYLLSELLAAKTRPGRYGGALENRTRLVRNVLGKIRAEFGTKVLLATRMNVYDGVPYRTDAATGIGVPRPYPLPYEWAFGADPKNPLRPDLSEPKEAVALLRAAGVALVNVSMGNPYSNPHIGRPFEKTPVDGYESPEHPLIGVARHFSATAEIQRAFPDLPVAGTGYSWLQRFLLAAGEANVRDRRVTVVGVGRGALAYPDFARDGLAKGDLDIHKVCLAVSFCTTLMRAKGNDLGQYPTGCVPRDPVYAGILKEAVERSFPKKTPP